MCSLSFSRNFGAASTCFLTFGTRMSNRWELNTNWPPVTTSAPPFARKMSSSNGSTFVVGARARASAARGRAIAGRPLQGEHGAGGAARRYRRRRGGGCGVRRDLRLRRAVHGASLTGG